MATDLLGNGAASVKVAVYATLMYDIISATNSSPQTTEINAKRRSGTLMKWVRLGLLQGAAFVALGTFLEWKTGGTPWAPLVGGGLAGGLLWAQYQHALNAGMASTAGGTES